MVESWNAHDIDGVMSAYWNSPHLLVVIQEEQFQGWEVLYHAYKTGYPDPNAMGHVEPSRVQIRFLKSDVAVANNWWIVNHPKFKVRGHGKTKMKLQNSYERRKILLAHSNLTQTC